MAKKKMEGEEVVFAEKIDLVSAEFGREDLNKLRDTVNMLVERVNNG